MRSDSTLEEKYGLTAPHSEVVAALPALKGTLGRSVLDLGSGRGRNSFFLAKQGFEVHAVDRSTEAIARLQEIQRAEALEVSSQVYDINRANLGEIISQGCDHVLSTVVFQFLDAQRVPSVIKDIQALTRPGGIHLIVAPINCSDLPCPIDFPFLFGEGELRAFYDGWELLRYEESPGEFHKLDPQGRRYQSRFVTMVAKSR